MDTELIDLRKNELWGARNRSKQLFQCSICGSLTNRITSAKYMGRRLVCPYRSLAWHGLLEKKIRLYRDEAHPRSYRAELLEEIRRILRENPPGKDIVGIVLMEQVHFASYQTIVTCNGTCKGHEHFLDWEPE